VVTRQLQVEGRTGKVCRPKTDVLPLCHATNLLKSDLSSLDFVVNPFFIKLFRTSSIDVVKQCQYHFDFPLLSVLWAKRVQKFEAKFYADM